MCSIVRRARTLWTSAIAVDLFRDPLPDEQCLHYRLGEFGSIDPQSHSVRTLKRIPPPRGFADGVGILIDLVASVHKTFLRVDLQGCAISADAPECGQPFFRRRRGFRLPSGPVWIHAQEAHVTGGRVKKCVADVGDAVCPLPCGAVREPLRVRYQAPHAGQLPGRVIGGLSPRLAGELDEYNENRPRDCSFHLLRLSLAANVLVIQPAEAYSRNKMCELSAAPPHLTMRIDGETSTR
jgi:hypothetical protein